MSWSKDQSNVLVNKKILRKSKQLKTINKAVELVCLYWLLNEFYRVWTRLSPFVVVYPLEVVFHWQQRVEFINRATVFRSLSLSLSATLNVRRSKRNVALHYVKLFMVTDRSNTGHGFIFGRCEMFIVLFHGCKYYFGIKPDRTLADQERK